MTLTVEGVSRLDKADHGDDEIDELIDCNFGEVTGGASQVSLVSQEPVDLLNTN